MGTFQKDIIRTKRPSGHLSAVGMFFPFLLVAGTPSECTKRPILGKDISQKKHMFSRQDTYIYISIDMVLIHTHFYLLLCIGALGHWKLSRRWVSLTAGGSGGQDESRGKIFVKVERDIATAV